MKDSDFLLKLRRHYTESEVVAAMEAQLKEKELEIGQLKAEIDYLSHQISENKVNLEHMVVERIREHNMWNEQQKLIRERGMEIHKLRQQNQELTLKLHNLSTTTGSAENDSF